MDIQQAMMDIQQAMLDDFHKLPSEQQKESVLLGGNARFVLRMTEGLDGDDEVGLAVKTIREALVRGIPSLGGEKI